jgi:hypothetical protein
MTIGDDPAVSQLHQHSHISISWQQRKKLWRPIYPYQPLSWVNLAGLPGGEIHVSFGDLADVADRYKQYY